MEISKILDKIDEHQLFVPMFQREYVWKRDDAKRLIGSLIKEYPIGTMLTWETNKPPKIKGKIRYNKEQGSVLILLDGQQRLTTLYMLIRGKIPSYYTKQEIVNDTRGLYINVETLELEYPSNKVKLENDPCWQNITEIFMKNIQALDIVEALEGKGKSVNRELRTQLSNNINAINGIHNRDFLMQAVPEKATVHEAIDVFHQVNVGGTGLTGAELALAQISSYWPEARNIFSQKLEELKNKGFEFNMEFILFLLLGCLYYEGSDIKKLHAADNNTRIRRVWKRLASQALDYVIDMMRDHAYVHHGSEVRSIYALIPIIVFFYHKRKESLNEKEVRKLVRWFYYSQLGFEYKHLIQDSLDRDLQIIRTSKNPLDELLGKVLPWGVEHFQIKQNSLTGASPRRLLSPIMLWYFRSREACCLQTGKKLLPNTSSQSFPQFQPIFSSSQLAKPGYVNKSDFFGEHPWVEELANQVILAPEAGTRSIKHAKSYLGAFARNYPDALVLQCIPENQALWDGKNFEYFLKTRSKTLADGLNSFLKGTANPPHQEVAVEELIKKGESSKLEFKSSLRWDIKENKINKNLENAVVNVVASFSNAGGGTLLIGVNDKGSVLGLNHDYHSFRGNQKNKDKFEQHLRRILRNKLDAGFVAVNVKIFFREIEEHEICQLEVQKFHEPIIIPGKGERGEPQGKFYIRNGNSSESLSAQEMSDYILKNFT